MLQKTGGWHHYRPYTQHVSDALTEDTSLYWNHMLWKLSKYKQDSGGEKAELTWLQRRDFLKKREFWRVGYCEQEGKVTAGQDKKRGGVAATRGLWGC